MSEKATRIQPSSRIAHSCTIISSAHLRNRGPLRVRACTYAPVWIGGLEGAEVLGTMGERERDSQAYRLCLAVLLKRRREIRTGTLKSIRARHR